MGSQTSTAPRQVSLLGIAVAAVAAALIAPSTAGAAAPCWQRVYDEWGTGAVRETHSQACYRAALSHLPFDMRAYTTAQRDIMTAMIAAARIREGGTPSSSESPRLSLGGGSGVAAAQATRSLQNRTPTPQRVAVPVTPVGNTGVSVPLHFWLALAFAFALVMAAAVRTLQGRLAARRALRDRFRNGDH